MIPGFKQGKEFVIQPQICDLRCVNAQIRNYFFLIWFSKSKQVEKRKKKDSRLSYINDWWQFYSKEYEPFTCCTLCCLSYIATINARLHELSFYCKICLIAVPSQRSIQSLLIKLHMKINKEVRLTTDKWYITNN